MRCRRCPHVDACRGRSKGCAEPAAPPHKAPTPAPASRSHRGSRRSPGWDSEPQALRRAGRWLAARRRRAIAFWKDRRGSTALATTRPTTRAIRQRNVSRMVVKTDCRTSASAGTGPAGPMSAAAPPMEMPSTPDRRAELPALQPLEGGVDIERLEPAERVQRPIRVAHDRAGRPPALRSPTTPTKPRLRRRSGGRLRCRAPRTMPAEAGSRARPVRPPRGGRRRRHGVRRAYRGPQASRIGGRRRSGARLTPIAPIIQKRHAVEITFETSARPGRRRTNRQGSRSRRNLTDPDGSWFRRGRSGDR